MSLLEGKTARTAALLLSLLGLIAVGAAGASPRGWELDAATRVSPPTVVTSARHYAFPLHVSKNHRYLVDRHSMPFMVVGDSPQALIGNLSLKDAATFIADRKAAGFDALWVNLLCATYTGCRSNGSSAPINHAPSAPATRMAFRSNSIRRWIACRRSTRNTRSTRA